MNNFRRTAVFMDWTSDYFNLTRECKMPATFAAKTKKTRKDRVHITFI